MSTTLAQRKADEAAQAEYQTAAQRLRGTAAGIEEVARCVAADPGLGPYADEVRTLKVRAYVTLVMKLLELADEADEKARSYDTFLGLA